MIVLSVNPLVSTIGIVGIALVACIIAFVAVAQRYPEITIRPLVIRVTGEPDALEMFYLTVFFVACFLMVYQPW